jgi:hypothetical protein
MAYGASPFGAAPFGGSAIQPLLQVGGSTVSPSATGASRVTVRRQEDSVVPAVDARLTRNMWDMATISCGLTVGGVIAHAPGAVVGGVVSYGVGYLRWQYINRAKP